MMRFWHISPVATFTGAIASRILRWPAMSSGLVGSSMKNGLAKASFVHPVDRLADLPHLVGVDHQEAVRPHHLARDGEPPDVVVEVAADLHLDVVEAGVHRLAAEPPQLVVGIAEPAGRGGVAGIALALERGDALGLARLGAAQDVERFLAASARR